MVRFRLSCVCGCQPDACTASPPPCLQALSLPAAPEAFHTWVTGFGFVPMTDEQQALVKGELRMLIFPGTHLLTHQLADSSTAAAGGGGQKAAAETQQAGRVVAAAAAIAKVRHGQAPEGHEVPEGHEGGAIQLGRSRALQRACWAVLHDWRGLLSCVGLAR
jgi:hypothetical protein